MRKSVSVELPEAKAEPYKLKDKIVEYIKKHPNCSISDLYPLYPYEQNVRRAVRELIHGHRIKQCLVALD